MGVGVGEGRWGTGEGDRRDTHMPSDGLEVSLRRA